MKMIPASVALRQQGAHDFAGCYDNLCALQSTAPLPSVKAHLENGILDINGDRLRLIDWPPILNTLKLNKNLRYVAFRSYFQPQGSNAKKQHYFRRRVPAVRSKQVTLFIAKSVAACLSISKAIKCIDLQGVPLREKDIKIIAEGLAKNKSLTHILFDYCQITDNGVTTLCRVIRNHLSITHVSMSGCNVTSKGAETIAKLIKHQSMKRHSTAWADGLRQRTPNLDCMSGIRRITLNSNPMIGDEGAVFFAESLRDDLWVKALDIQHCGVTSGGADHLLSSIEHNRTICVLDVRRNPMIDGATLRKLLGRVLLNGKESDEFEFPWIKEERPKDPYHTKRPRGSNPSKVVSRRKSLEGNPRPTGVPWRTAVRASQHKVDVSDDDSSDDVIIINSRSANSKTKVSDVNSSSLTSKPRVGNDGDAVNRNDSSYVKQLEIAVLDFKRRLSAATEQEKKLNSVILALETENSKLRSELRESFANSRIKSQIEDEGLLDSIETSFARFHDFLNTLGDLGLGSLVAEAGLGGGAFSLPFPTSNEPDNGGFDVNQKAQSVAAKRENHGKREEKREMKGKREEKREVEGRREEKREEDLPISSAIVIEGGSNKVGQQGGSNKVGQQGGSQPDDTSSKTSAKSRPSSKYVGSSKGSDGKFKVEVHAEEISSKVDLHSQKSGEKSQKSGEKSEKSGEKPKKIGGMSSKSVSEKVGSTTEEISEEILSEIDFSEDTF